MSAGSLIAGIGRARVPVLTLLIVVLPSVAFAQSPASRTDGDRDSLERPWHEYEAASPVTFSPVANGKVVVATADGQVICFGSRQTPTVDSLSPRGGNFPLP